MEISRRYFLSTSALIAGTGQLEMTRLNAADAPLARRFFMDLSCGRIGVKATFLESIDLAVRHGFEGVDPDGKYFGQLSDRQLGDTLADDRTLERVAEHPPAGPNATAGDAHRVDVFRVLPVDRTRDPGEHPGQVEAKDLPAGFRPGIVGADLGRTGESQVIGGSERGRRGLGARDEGRFGGSAGSDGSQPARLGQTESRRGLGLVR